MQKYNKTTYPFASSGDTVDFLLPARDTVIKQLEARTKNNSPQAAAPATIPISILSEIAAVGSNVAFVVGVFAGVDTNVCVDVKSVSKVMILSTRGLFDVETVFFVVNSSGNTSVEEIVVVLSRVLSDVGEVKAFAVCTLGCGKDVGVIID